MLHVRMMERQAFPALSNHSVIDWTLAKSRSWEFPTNGSHREERRHTGPPGDTRQWEQVPSPGGTKCFHGANVLDIHVTPAEWRGKSWRLGAAVWGSLCISSKDASYVAIPTAPGWTGSNVSCLELPCGPVRHHILFSRESFLLKLGETFTVLSREPCSFMSVNNFRVRSCCFMDSTHIGKDAFPVLKVHWGSRDVSQG